MSASEAAGIGRTPIGADLKAGLDTLSYDQEITFTYFKRLVLPLDGYVFWVRGDLLNPPDAREQKVMGSLHVGTDRRQDEPETYSVNTVVFTSQESVDFLNTVASDALWIGSFGGLDFAFSSIRGFYKQANLWHYVGDAVNADMRSQVITSADQLYALSLIASNSLPIWLGLNTFNPGWPFYPPPPPSFVLYPSFLSPPNIVPPWATVHIGDDDTHSLVSAPDFGSDQSQTQIAVDKVRITLWGCSNDQAMNFIAMVNQFSYDTGLIGVRNMPVVRDAKRTQRELSTLAQKKIIDYEVSYIQGRLANYSRQIISGAIPTFIPAGYPSNRGFAANTIRPFVSAATGAVT